MKLLIVFLLFFLVSCGSNQDSNISPTNLDSITKPVEKEPANDIIIISERIDGPANIRDTINGELLFSLNDKVPVATTDIENKWLQIGTVVDVSKEQMDKLLIPKDSKLFVNGKEIGQTIQDVSLQGAFETEGKLKGELVGYTSVTNIRTNTIPENVFSEIVNSSANPRLSAFTQFLKDFEFQDFDSLIQGFKAYEIDENWIDDPSPLLRLWILFRDNEFYGVFHSRRLVLNNSKKYKTKRGFYFSTFSEEHETNKKLIDAFNSFIVQVD